ncbi:MAG: nitrous oxide reductase family maturation protein NosD [Candidatus Hermodarchaeota archaeon]
MRNNQQLVTYILCIIVLLFSIALIFTLECFIGVRTENPTFFSDFWNSSSNLPCSQTLIDFHPPLSSSSSWYTEHSPIFINGDADFLAQAAIEGWPGSGTSWEDPLIIANYTLAYLTTNSSRNLIDIRNTRLKFKIYNNLLTGLNKGGVITYGISLNNVTNAVIVNNTILTNYKGISVVSTQETVEEWANKVVNNTIINNDYAVWIDSCNYIRLANNTIKESEVGIFLQRTHFTTLATNFLSNSQVGVVFKEVENCIVFRNIFYNNNLGIESYISAFNNRMQENDFIGNSLSFLTSQASDDGTNNTFENNYWADWTQPDGNNDGIVDHPYPIDGTAQNIDLCPQNSPNNPVLIKTSSSPRLLSNSLQGVLYVLILFLILVLLVGAGLFLSLKFLFPNIMPYIRRHSFTSLDRLPLESPREGSLILTASIFDLLFGIVWYVLAAESSLLLLLISSSTLLTGIFWIDLIDLIFLALFYPFMHPETMLKLFSALVVSSDIISQDMILLGVILALLHIFTAIFILINTTRVAQLRIAKMVPPDKEKVEELLDEAQPTKEKLLDYVKKVRSLLETFHKGDE